MCRVVAVFLALCALVVPAWAAAPKPEAIVVVLGDLHSAYDRTAQFVARVERIKTENPGVPLAVLIDGDSFEYGNVVARRTEGAVDFAMFTALVRLAPTVINLGNHEPEFYDPAETVKRLEATGLKVVGNLRDRATGKLYAPASLRLKLGTHEATIAGLTTDWLNTYRLAIRPQLDLADPVVWARENLPALFRDAALPIVLSHAGLRADRDILPLVPPGTLFAGAHDHLRFIHRETAPADKPRTVYFHSGSWMDYVSIARLQRTGRGLEWDVMQEPLLPRHATDPALAALVRETLAKHLTPEETSIVARAPQAFSPADAARFAVDAARRAALADVALIGGTTFGAGLPAGDISRFAFDACVRFDGPLHATEVEGAHLLRILARCNQTPDTPLADRNGENLIAVAAPGIRIAPGRTYRFVTTDWVSKNAEKYLGENPPALAEVSGVKLKAAVLAALEPAK
ncbi:MAG: metallophosphoesterase [Verrucomicrobiota bacterium]